VRRNKKKNNNADEAKTKEGKEKTKENVRNGDKSKRKESDEGKENNLVKNVSESAEKEMKAVSKDDQISAPAKLRDGVDYRDLDAIPVDIPPGEEGNKLLQLFQPGKTRAKKEWLTYHWKQKWLEEMIVEYLHKINTIRQRMDAQEEEIVNNCQNGGEIPARVQQDAVAPSADTQEAKKHYKNMIKEWTKVLKLTSKCEHAVESFLEVGRTIEAAGDDHVLTARELIKKKEKELHALTEKIKMLKSEYKL